jgi:hypothetical protein
MPVTELSRDLASPDAPFRPTKRVAVGALRGDLPGTHHHAGETSPSPSSDHSLGAAEFHGFANGSLDGRIILRTDAIPAPALAPQMTEAMRREEGQPKFWDKMENGENPLSRAGFTEWGSSGMDYLAFRKQETVAPGVVCVSERAEAVRSGTPDVATSGSNGNARLEVEYACRAAPHETKRPAAHDARFAEARIFPAEPVFWDNRARLRRRYFQRTPDGVLEPFAKYSHWATDKNGWWACTNFAGYACPHPVLFPHYGIFPSESVGDAWI